jgi:hypothetical protein
MHSVKTLQAAHALGPRGARQPGAILEVVRCDSEVVRCHSTGSTSTLQAVPWCAARPRVFAINVSMNRNFSNQNPGETSLDADANAPTVAPNLAGDAQPNEPLEVERSQFTRRLESFGLGERQSPLLTDCVWSLDADGNLR